MAIENPHGVFSCETPNGKTPMAMKNYRRTWITIFAEVNRDVGQVVHLKTQEKSIPSLFVGPHMCIYIYTQYMQCVYIYIYYSMYVYVYVPIFDSNLQSTSMYHHLEGEKNIYIKIRKLDIPAADFPRIPRCSMEGKSTPEANNKY
jgi:hypothetical protein